MHDIHFFIGTKKFKNKFFGSNFCFYIYSIKQAALKIRPNKSYQHFKNKFFGSNYPAYIYFINNNLKTIKMKKAIQNFLGVECLEITKNFCFQIDTLIDFDTEMKLRTFLLKDFGIVCAHRYTNKIIFTK